MNRRRSSGKPANARAKGAAEDRDPETIHREMLEHLDENPPPRPRSTPTPKVQPPPTPPSKATPPERPRLMLRKMRLEPALVSLENFVRQHRHRETDEVVVVVGKGHGSGEGGPVIGPAVRQWCNSRPELVIDWRVAPPSEGGDGALILRLVAGR